MDLLNISITFGDGHSESFDCYGVYIYPEVGDLALLDSDFNQIFAYGDDQWAEITVNKKGKK